MNRKNSYKSPEIQAVKLDNIISLIMTSEPPMGPEEGLTYKVDNNPLLLKTMLL